VGARSLPEYRGSLDAALTQPKDSTVGTTEQALVFPPDTRQPISNTLGWPWRAQVRMYSNWSNGTTTACSGTLISSKVVLTASHCIFDKESDSDGYADSVKVVPALAGTYMPFGDAWSVQVLSNQCYVESQNDICDYGMVVLDRDVGNVTGWAGMAPWNSNSDQLRLVGYPQDKGAVWPYYSYGTVMHKNDKKLWHLADEYEGMSGGGLAQYQYSNQIRAVQIGGDYWYGPYGPYNAAARINDSRSVEIGNAIAEYDGWWERPSDQLHWIDLEPAGANSYYAPTMVSIQNHYFDMFLHGTGDQVLYTYGNRSTGQVPFVADLGGAPIVGRVGAVSRAANLMDLFVTKANGSVLTKAWNGSAWVPSQTGWWDLGGDNIGGEPTAVSWGQDRIDVFARSKSGVPKHTRWIPSAGWSVWEELGGGMTGSVAAVSRAPGIIDIFIRGTDGHLYTKAWWEGTGWLPSKAGWVDLGGDLNDSPAASTLGSDNIDVFARWSDGGTWTIRWPGTSWGSWTSLGGATTAPPVTYKNAWPRIFFVRWTDGDIRYKQAWSGDWDPDWQTIGGDLYNVAVTGNMLEIFLAGTGFDDDVGAPPVRLRYSMYDQWNQ
jgi:V8-like Glu-specific endopeptidase